MYAIIATGGKQYKVSEGDVIKVEKIDAEAGNTVTFDQVIAVSAFCGPQWPPVRLPVATRRCQWTGLISYFSFDHYDVMFRHPFEKRVGGNLILHQHRRPCLWLALRADNAAP